MTQKPSVGRIVHFHDEKTDPIAAIITKVWSDEYINLQIFPTGEESREVTSVPFDAAGEGFAFSWSWPPRV